MKKLLTLLFLIPLFCFGQASKIISTQANPIPVDKPNFAIVNLLDTPVGQGNIYRFYIAKWDSLKWNVYQVIGLKDSSQNWGDTRYAQLLGAYTNPAFVNSLSAAKVFGLSSVATTGAYSDLTGLPNLSLYYLNSNPSGFINGINNGMVVSALGFTPQMQLNGSGFIKANGTTISYDNSTYVTTSSLSTTLSGYTTTGALSSGLSNKENTIIAGTTPQYWRGDKSWQTLNTAAVTESGNLYYTDTRSRAAISLTTTGSGAATYNSTTGVLNVPTPNQKRIESYSGTTNASGLYTVTYTTPYSVTPNVQFQINGGGNKQTILLTSSTTTGFTLYVQLRADVLGLLPSYSNVSGQAVDVMVFEK